MNRFAFLPLLLAALAAADEPPEANRTKAKKALRAFAKGHAARTLKVTYTQERTTALTVKPLRSRGTLYFSRADSCLVFDVAAPKTARLRLDATTYQVYRPDHKRAERYVFENFSPGRALLQVLRADVAKLEKAHEVTGYAEDAKAVRVKLRPKEKEFRKYVERLTVTLAKDGHVLRRISYRDADGDTVRIDFGSFVRNEELPEKLFAKELPEGTRLTVTKVGASGEARD